MSNRVLSARLLWMKDLLHPSKWKKNLFTIKEMGVMVPQKSVRCWKNFHKCLGLCEALWYYPLKNCMYLEAPAAKSFLLWTSIISVERWITLLWRLVLKTCTPENKYVFKSVLICELTQKSDWFFSTHL